MFCYTNKVYDMLVIMYASWTLVSSNTAVGGPEAHYCDRIVLISNNKRLLVYTADCVDKTPDDNTNHAFSKVYIWINSSI